MQRAIEDHGFRSLLDSHAEIEHQHIVGDVTHYGEIVGNEEIGNACIPLQVGEEIEHLRLD